MIENREDRRQLKRVARVSLRDSVGYVVVTFDGKGSPKFFCDVECCDNWDHDIRHGFLWSVKKFVEHGIGVVEDHARKRYEELETRGKVEEIKRRRSEELGGEGTGIDAEGAIRRGEGDAGDGGAGEVVGCESVSRDGASAGVC